ncbi:DoxX family protein [Algirhabdus cladophorae]|uniref:DoxX family protein n=1 Tax=Algirhabdus cladophorae TaxID=3377108 RepID=UPI003B8455B8
MTSLINLHHRLFGGLEKNGHWMTPTLARFMFVAVLFSYYWSSAKTKVGDGIFGFLSPSDGAYIQIFPKAVEAAGYDTSQLNAFHWLIATAGTVAEFVLPVLIVVGLLTRLASIGMIGFIVVQSIVDVTGHGVGGADLGAWFDKASGSLIMDQRGLWIFLLLVLVIQGAGPLSLDRLFGRSDHNSAD